MRPDLQPHSDRPDIVVADASPLIHLAQAGALHLLHEFGGAVVLVDLVADEATRDLTKPGAEALQRWIKAGAEPGSNTPVRVETTETGRAVTLARVTDPGFTMRNGGENAMVDWLMEKVRDTSTATIVLYENGRVPRVVAGQAIDADIDVLTTRAFLELAERWHLVPSADAAWKRMVEAALTASPLINVPQQRRPPTDGGGR